MLRNIAEEFNTEKNENLKGAISSIVELVILDDVTLEATVMYRIGYLQGISWRPHGDSNPGRLREREVS